jgi:Matrixin
MNRRTLICGLATWIATLPGSGHAQSQGRRYPWWVPWNDTPEVVVISAADDDRLPAVREAVDFWNAEFSKLGSPFRFGSLAHVVETVPAYGVSELRSSWETKTFTHVANILSQMAPTGDVIVALFNDIESGAFTSEIPDRQKVMVAISKFRLHPLPGAATRNVVAHELGHALGLGHNDEANTLMSGKRRSWYSIPSEGFLPLTEGERITLFAMYPPTWRPKRPRKWMVDPPYPGWQPRQIGGWITESSPI